MQNSPQPFHGTQVTPVMLPTKSRPLGLASARPTELLFDPTYCTSIGWHLGTSGGGLVIASRLVAFYLVGSYVFILQQYHTNSHGRTQCGHTYFHKTSCLRSPRLAGVGGVVQEFSIVWHVVSHDVLTWLLVLLLLISRSKYVILLSQWYDYFDVTGI